ncbi:MAG: type II toxin-antitoxin system Phd/YefM family antitoxin [Pedosphaera sp.]|nr:type II toxin-antitoxin system Phd/YefM family antitoxin [Pedosphaera sp.]
MISTINLHEAKTHLSRLVARVERGESITIARDHRPVAMLVPLPAAGPRKPGRLKGKISILPNFFDPLPESELSAWNSEK